MPSPTSMTRPTSCRSTSASKPASWRLMISLISPALIILVLSESSLGFRQALFHLLQLSVHAAVHDEAADLRDEAAEQVLVHDLFDEDRAAAKGARQTRG